MRVCVCVFSYLSSCNFGLLFNQETQQDKGELTETTSPLRISRVVRYYKYYEMVVWVKMLESIFIRVIRFGVFKKGMFQGSL